MARVSRGGEPPEAALARVLDGEGRLLSWPRRPAVRLAALRHLAARLDPEAVLTEREVTARLAGGLRCLDPVTLRRELVDAGLLSRDPRGRAYRVTPAG